MADPIPNAGTTTSPDEFRKLLSRLFTPGVLSGLVLSAGSGLSVNVTAGYMAVTDGSGKVTFLPLDAANLAGLAPNGTVTVYATYRTTGDLQAYLTTSAPSTPYEVVGTLTTNGTGVTAIDNAFYPAATAGKRHRSDFPQAVGRYFQTDTKINSPLGLVVSGSLDVAGTNTPPSMPNGVRLGGTSFATKRCATSVGKTTATALSAGVWTAISFTDARQHLNDYSGTNADPYASTRFTAPVAGRYTLSVEMPLTKSDGTQVSDGNRYLRVRRYGAGGTDVEIRNLDQFDSEMSTTVDRLSGQVLINLNANDYLVVEVYSSVAFTVGAGTYKAGDAARAEFALVMVN